MRLEHPLDEAVIRKTISEYFESLDKHDKESIMKAWHPEGRLFITSSGLEVQNQEFLVSLPNSIGFEVKEITVLDIGERIGVVRVVFDMLNENKTIGNHHGFFAMVREDDEWKIASHLDFGAEVQE